MGQSIGVIVHDFQTKLAESQTLSDEPAWIAFYERVWPKQIIAHQRIDKDSVYQRWGVDREIKLANGQQFSIDEKKRTEDYGDMLIEEISVYYGPGDARNKVGWALDANKRCDFVAYAVTPARTCYLLPFDLLRRTARACLPDWQRAAGRHYPKLAQNRGYVTRNCPVPWDQLWTDMRRVSQQSFVGDLVLPAPFVVGDQMRFAFGVEE